MQINTSKRQYENDFAVLQLISFLESNQGELNLSEANVYYNFPLYKDYDDNTVIVQIMVVSKYHGVIIVGTSNEVKDHKELITIERDINNITGQILAKLIKNPNLKKSKMALLFDVETVIFAPLMENSSDSTIGETNIFVNETQLRSFIKEIEVEEPLNENVFVELTSTIEGSKGLIRPKIREITNSDPKAKGNIVQSLEREIASFDEKQKILYMSTSTGIERIRGLAGSGKTIILALKVAILHLRQPTSHILFTFWTKSLYQHIQRIITRFYRQFDDKDPDWNYIHISHAWGGATLDGVYYNTCVRFRYQPLTFTEARKKSSQPFEYVCKQLLKERNIQPIYDYVFVDEAQDFPASFLELCTRLAHNNSITFAYDELQTIFQTKVPDPKEFAPGIPFEDTVLYKCYRNPREILVCAHALGFGIYGQKMVQMLENKDHWEDLGYSVIKYSTLQNNKFKEGSETIIERPVENSLNTVSSLQKPNDIVKTEVFNEFIDEITWVSENIKKDIDEGLLPEDISVVVADDRNAKNYLIAISEMLQEMDIKTNNILEDGIGLKNFQNDGYVTLSSVHKAKGNEAYMVYVIGIDALFISPGVRERNLIFTAMTRAKGWIRLTGIGELAELCKKEIDLALHHFPNLVFNYPSEEELKIMKRDLESSAIEKQEKAKDIDRVIEKFGVEEIKRHMAQRAIPKSRE